MRDARMDSCDLEVDGMSCAGCAGRAERALLSAPGVERAHVNFATGRARVEGPGGAGRLAADHLAEIVTKAGYPARVAEAVPKPREDMARAGNSGAQN